MYIMLQIIVERTHSVSQPVYNVENNSRTHTSTHTPIMSIYVHTISVESEEKKLLQDVSSFKGRRLREQIQHFFFFSSLLHLSVVVYRSSSVCTEDIVRSCRDTKCLIVNKYTDQSIDEQVKNQGHRSSSVQSGRRQDRYLHITDPGS